MSLHLSMNVVISLTNDFPLHFFYHKNATEWALILISPPQLNKLIHGRRIPWSTNKYFHVFPTITSILGAECRTRLQVFIHFSRNIVRAGLWNDTKLLQVPISPKFCSSEGENWPHNHRLGCCPRESRNSTGYRPGTCQSNGAVAGRSGSYCLLPFGVHVPRGLETFLQRKRVLYISTSFSLVFFPSPLAKVHP